MADETIWQRIESWFHRVFLCRLGYHRIGGIYEDDGRVVVEGCLFCGKGFVAIEENDSHGYF